eukprot:gene21149-27403_t
MVNTLEKEMMTVGTMAFTFKIIINSNAIHNEHWIFALEFADLLVPITSFCFCFKEIEFRIFHIIFCDHYHIQRNAFAYDEYVQRIFEKYLLDIITIKPLDWFVTEENKMDSHLESNRLSGSDLRSAVSDAKSKAISSYQEHISIKGLISFVLYVYVVKCGALLKALIFLDHDTVEEIIEQTETSHQLAQTMKDKMISRLKDMGDPEVELFNLYHLMDNSGHNTLRRSELQLFVEAMGITFSRKRWRQMFRQIDSDNDDSISFEELVLFVFPEHNAAIVK